MIWEIKERCPMDEKVFNAFRSLVYEKSGISLNDGKKALVSARIGKRMRALSVECHNEYLNLVKEDEHGEELIHMLDAISTNVTSFYREAEHFDFLAERLQEWHAAGQSKFRIWSAASSSGEEPYTLAITLLENLPAEVDARILATDISTKVLGQCREGVYREDKLDPVDFQLRAKYFDKCEEGFRIRDVVKRKVLFKRLNLSTPPFPMKGPLDVIFCRNVMIYFDNEVRTKLLNEAYRLLRPGGYLMVGHAESLTGMVSDFKTVKPSIYIKS
ncbi:MAG: CheR family methyltransferase [Planctomycetota bacterium]|jgi:chemotaxis protein methyltransferase CheR